MALSASAPSNIQATITESLKLVDPVVVHSSLNRPNVFYTAGKMMGLAVSLDSLQFSCIIQMFNLLRT